MNSATSFLVRQLRTDASGISVQGGPLSVPSLSVSNQFVQFNATATGTTGSNLTFNVPPNVPFLTNSGSLSSVPLAAGQYMVFLFNSTQLNSSGAGSGAYGDIGISQNGANIMSNRYNFNGFGGNYFTNMNASTAVYSDGTSASYISAFCVLGNGAAYPTSTQTLSMRIIKTG